MSRTNFDTFALVINFINDDQMPYHVIIGLFETSNTFGTTLAKHMKFLLVEYQLTSTIIVYVKDEGTNLNTLVFTFTSIISCAPL
jgi:hypothetical protein